jgi:DNA-3-methyladenine glycosylase II
MGRLIAEYPDGSLQTRGDAFGTLMRSIIGQQVSVKAADAITQRLEKLMDTLLPQDFLKIEPELLREAGLSRQKITYITGLSKSYLESPFNADTFDGKSDEEVFVFLKEFKGIGRWTAEMFLLFHLARPDVFPIQDIGLQKAIQKHYATKDYASVCDRWRPYRTVATWYLWRSLDPIPVVYSHFHGLNPRLQAGTTSVIFIAFPLSYR